MTPQLAERRHELHLGPVGPWAADIEVTAVRTRHGRRSSIPQDWVFEVSASWTGPPMLGMPDSAEPIHTRDVYVLPVLEDARALAHKAADAFRAGGDWAPDLRVLAGVRQEG